jgi:hypothetical protein
MSWQAYVDDSLVGTGTLLVVKWGVLRPPPLLFFFSVPLLSVVYVCLYICMCVCVCACACASASGVCECACACASASGVCECECVRVSVAVVRLLLLLGQLCFALAYANTRALSQEDAVGCAAGS